MIQSQIAFPHRRVDYSLGSGSVWQNPPYGRGCDGGGTTKWRQTTPTASSLGGFTYQPSAAPTMLPCLQNPTTHYNAMTWTESTGWVGTDAVIIGNPITWIDKGNIKSIYDPCPYGYRVPIDGSWVGFPAQSWTNGDIKGGGVWQSTWWPAAGFRYYTSTALVAVANEAVYWSSSPHASIAYYSYGLYFNYGGNVGPRNYYGRSYGFSLRCVQE